MLGLASFPPLLLVMVGGSIGAALRYLVGVWTMARFGTGLPLATLAVNLIGGLAMGLLAGALARLDEGGMQLRLLLGVGVLGGFTTFSAFSLEVTDMLMRGEFGTAAAYATASVAGCVMALFAGLMIVRAL